MNRILKPFLLSALVAAACGGANVDANTHPDAADLALPQQAVQEPASIGDNLLAPPEDDAAEPTEPVLPVETIGVQATESVAEPAPAPAAADVGELAGALPGILPTEPSPLLELTPFEKAFASREAQLIQQIRLLDLQLEVRDRQAKLRETAGMQGTTATALASPPQPAVSETVVLDTMPTPRPPAHPFRLVAIWGAEGSLKAEFLTEAGKRVVAPGHTIQGRWMLDTLNHGEAVIRDGKRRATLRLGQ